MSDPALQPLETFPDTDTQAQAAADAIAAALRSGLNARGAAAFAACGGSTPIAAYRRLSAADLRWEAVTVVPTDERWVDPRSPESNEGLLRRDLLTGRASVARLVSLWTAEVPLPVAAERVGLEVAAVLPFDLVLLGMGEDGHFASLFPGSPALADGLDTVGGRTCVAVPSGRPAPVQARISLTLRALLQARRIILLISGEAKRRTLDAALAGADLPVRAILAQQATPVRVLWAP